MSSKRRKLTEDVNNIIEKIAKTKEELKRKELEERMRILQDETKDDNIKEQRKQKIIQRGKDRAADWIEKDFVPNQERLTNGFTRTIVSVPDTNCTYTDWSNRLWEQEDEKMVELRAMQTELESITKHRVFFGFADLCEKTDPCYRPPNDGVEQSKDPGRPSILKIDLTKLSKKELDRIAEKEEEERIEKERLQKQ